MLPLAMAGSPPLHLMLPSGLLLCPLPAGTSFRSAAQNAGLRPVLRRDWASSRNAWAACTHSSGPGLSGVPSQILPTVGAYHQPIGGPCFLQALGLIWRVQGALCHPVKAKRGAGLPLFILSLLLFLGSLQQRFSGAGGPKMIRGLEHFSYEQRVGAAEFTKKAAEEEHD